MSPRGSLFSLHILALYDASCISFPLAPGSVRPVANRSSLLPSCPCSSFKEISQSIHHDEDDPPSHFCHCHEHVAIPRPVVHLPDVASISSESVCSPDSERATTWPTVAQAMPQYGRPYMHVPHRRRRRKPPRQRSRVLGVDHHHRTYTTCHIIQAKHSRAPSPAVPVLCLVLPRVGRVNRRRHTLALVQLNERHGAQPERGPVNLDLSMSVKAFVGERQDQFQVAET